AFGDLHLNGCVVAIERRRPLVRLAANEAVEAIKPLAGRPAVIGPRYAGFPICDVVVLAKERRAVTVLAQCLGHHGGIRRNLPAVARITTPYFRNNACAG